MSVLRKVRLLFDWFIDWVILPWFTPNPGARKKARGNDPQEKAPGGEDGEQP